MTSLTENLNKNLDCAIFLTKDTSITKLLQHVTEALDYSSTVFFLTNLPLIHTFDLIVFTVFSKICHC